MGFENTLAQIPGLGGYLAKRQFNDQQGMNELTQASGAMGVLSKLQEHQERAQIKDALSTTQSFEEAVIKLRRIGTPAAINSIKELTALKNSEMEMAQKQREAAPFTKENLARNMIPGSPAQPAVTDVMQTNQSMDTFDPVAAKPAIEPKVDMDAIGRQVALTGMKGFEANATREAAMQAKKDALMTRLYQIQLQSKDKNISLAQQRFLAEQADQTKRMIAALAASNRQPPAPVAIIGEDGKPVYVERNQAIGKAPANALSSQDVIPPEAKDLHGNDYLQTLPTGLQNTVKAIVEGKVPLTSFSVRNNQRDAMIQRAVQYDPTFEAGKAPARMAVQKDFTSGVAARNVTAINTAIRHMGTLYDLGKALENNDIKVLNTVLNRVATETGDPRVNNFDTAKSAVGNELMRVFRQVNASEQETKDWEAKFSSSSSPAQLRGAIKAGVDLLQGRIEAVDEQWKRGMDTDKGYPNLLTPVTKDILGKIGGNPKRRAVDNSSNAWKVEKVQ